jgi:hypothetical protein
MEGKDHALVDAIEGFIALKANRDSHFAYVSLKMEANVILAA